MLPMNTAHSSRTSLYNETHARRAARARTNSAAIQNLTEESKQHVKKTAQYYIYTVYIYFLHILIYKNKTVKESLVSLILSEWREMVQQPSQAVVGQFISTVDPCWSRSG